MAVQQFKGYLVPGTINQLYTNLVNNVPVKPPYKNDSYRENFTGFRRSEDNTRLYKREGFTECFPDVFGGFIPTDLIEVNGKRYFYTVDSTHTQAKIFVQCDILLKDNCTKRTEPGCCQGYFTDITEYSFKLSLSGGGTTTVTQNFFPTTECTYDKFNVFSYIKGRTITEGCNGVVRNQLVGNTIVSTLYDSTGAAVPATVGNLVYIWAGPPSVVGQVRNITGTNSIYSGQPSNIVVDFPWLGIRNIPIEQNFVRDPAQNKYVLNIADDHGWIDPNTGLIVPDFVEEFNVCYTVMDGYGDVLGFATSDGLFVLHNDDCATGKFLPFGGTLQVTNNNIIAANKIYSSFFTYGGQAGYLDVKNGIIYLGLLGFNNGYFLIEKSIPVGTQYDSVLELGHYLLLLGPNNIGIIYRSNTLSFGINDVLYEPLLKNIGYFSKDSFINDKGSFYMISNGKYLYKIDIVPENDYITTTFKVTLTDISQFIRADLDMLDRDRGDKVFMSSTEDDMRIFIVDNDPLGSINGTKILFLDYTFKFRHKRMICEVYLRNEKYGCRYGEGLWSNTGLTDDGNAIKQIIGMNFDQELALTKTVANVDMMVGYQSNIGIDNTLLKACFDLGGYRIFRKFRNFQRSQYLQHVAAIKNKQIVDLFEDFPIGVGIFGGNGFDITPVNYNNELEAYCGYEPIPQHKTLSPCDQSDMPNVQAEPCKSQYPIGWIQNEDDSNDEGYRQISKFSVIRYPAGFEGENFYFEIVCDNNDAIEFGGFVFNYDVFDNTVGIPNTLTYPFVTGNKLDT